MTELIRIQRIHGMLFNLEPLRWIVEGNTAALYRGGISLTQYSEPKQISLRYGEYNEFHYELTKTAVSLYLNGKLIDTICPTAALSIYVFCHD